MELRLPTAVWLVAVEGTRGFGELTEQKIYIKGRDAVRRFDRKCDDLNLEMLQNPSRKFDIYVSLWRVAGVHGGDVWWELEGQKVIAR